VDGLGSTRVLTDLDGEVVATYTYDAFGELLDSTGEVENDYLFAGEPFDGELEQYYLRQRFYDAGVGRFTRRDSFEGRIGEPITLHKYLYGNVNPVYFVDPSGLYSIGEISAANAIRDILNNLQIDNGIELINRTLSGEDPSPIKAGIASLFGLAVDFGIPVLFLGMTRWGFWDSLPKQVVGNKEYAVINGRLYAGHAIDRMTPGGFGVAAGGSRGRGVPSLVVEDVLTNGNVVHTRVVNGKVRPTRELGDIRVTTEVLGSVEIIITVERR